MYAEVRSDHETGWAAMEKVSELLGIGTTETLRKRVRRAEVDQCADPGHVGGVGRDQAAAAGER